MAVANNVSFALREKDTRPCTGPVIGRSATAAGSTLPRADGGTGRLLQRTVDPFDDHAASRETVKAFLARYCPSDQATVGAEGLECLWRDLGLAGNSDKHAWALLWKLGAERCDRLSCERFIEGCLQLNTDSLDRLRRELPNLLYDAKRSFRPFYRSAFRIASQSRGEESDGAHSKRQLARPRAISLWRLTLPVCSGDALRFESAWYDYLEENDIASVDEVCWMAFLQFSQAVHSDFSNFSQVSAQWWPACLREFAAREVAKREDVLSPV